MDKKDTPQNTKMEDAKSQTKPQATETKPTKPETIIKDFASI